MSLIDYQMALFWKPSLAVGGSNNLNYRLGWTTHIFGDSQLLGYTPPNQPMRPYSLEPLSLVHGKEFGRVGLQGNASSSCGLWPIIDVGQQIDLLKGALTTHRNAHSVIRLENQLIICWSLVFSPGNFGSASCSSLGCKLLRHGWMNTVLLIGGQEQAAGFLVRLKRELIPSSS